MDDILEQCRRNFGAVPRQFSLYDRLTYLQTQRPFWCTDRDDLRHFFAGREKLLREGVVVWAQIVQANSMLFRPGRFNCPGDVVYCLDTNAPNTLETLAALAPRLYELKGTTPADPMLSPIAQYLTNERIRVFGLPVPPSYSPDLPCAMSTLFFDRKHLPGRCLRQGFFPLLLNRTAPYIAMPLPSRYWPDGMKRMWRR